jgi:hypothetical protein
MEITLGDVDRLVSAIVDEFGPYHRAGGGEEGLGCIYFTSPDNGLTIEPVCIVAQVFHRLGILGLTRDPNDPTSYDVSTCHIAGDSGPWAGWQRAEDTGFVFTDEAKAYLNDAQQAQDGRDESNGDNEQWGDAQAYARREATRRATPTMPWD